MIKKTVNLTADGKAELEKELDELIKNRPVVTERIATARAFGDLCENVEYRAARAEQKLAENRIAEIEDILKSAKIIESGAKDTVCLGAVVTIDMAGKTATYTIVGTTEANPTEGKISDVSPIGQALLNKKVNDSFDFNGKTITIKNIA